jgi:hypothetical protein
VVSWEYVWLATPAISTQTYKGIMPTMPIEMQAPRADKMVLETLPAYYTYLQTGGFSKEIIRI